MKHAREDYNRIQDPDNKIPEDEPVFLIRAQDVVGPAAVKAWALIHSTMGGNEDITLLAYEHAKKMEEWQDKNGSKLADL